MNFSFFKTKTPINWLWLSMLIILLDQATKYWVTHSMALFDSVAVIPYFNITLLHNYGAAFSFLADAGGWQRWFFIALALIVTAAVVFWLRKLPKENHRFLAIGLALIIGGALGNVIDRAMYGYVIDFIDIYYGTWHWPAFNVADSAITVGAIIMIIDSLFLEPRRKKTTQ